MKFLLFCFNLIFIACSTISNTPENQIDNEIGTESSQEKKLYELIMAYRKQMGLSEIPLSKSLTLVARTHVKDLGNNNPNRGSCNLHSWSDKGIWKPVCYTSDHAQASLMWSKPRELTSYQGNGYEIAAQGVSSAEIALNLWKKNANHEAVLMNRGVWSEKWQAIGIGMYKNYAVVWFGKEKDTE